MRVRVRVRVRVKPRGYKCRHPICTCTYMEFKHTYMYMCIYTADMTLEPLPVLLVWEIKTYKLNLRCTRQVISDNKFNKLRLTVHTSW